jgi:hypothetical protein
MFTVNFANKVIALAAQNQPHFLYDLMHFFMHIFLLNPPVFNSFIAITQLMIGALILYKPTRRIGLIFSIVWALFIWIIGEGLGAILTGYCSLLMGGPGAAILYVLISLAVLPKQDKTGKLTDKAPEYWLVFVWSIIWIGGAIYQLLPGQNSAADVSSMILNNTSGNPGWLASIDIHTSNLINSTVHTGGVAMHMNGSQMVQMTNHQNGGYWLIIILVLVQLFIGIVVLLPGIYRKIAIFIGVVISLLFWIVGQSFGGIFTGLGTDFNSGPLFVLLGVAILVSPNIDKYVSKVLDSAEKLLT